MKIKLIRLLIMGSKLVFYGISMQLLCIGLLLAEDGNAQKILRISDVKLKLEVENATVGEVFENIESQTYYHFFFDASKVEMSKKVKLAKKSGSISEILLQVSEQTDLKFRQINNVINVNHKDHGSSGDVEMEVSFQGRTISGKVISGEDNSGLPGVNVIVKGTSQGTVTDVEGNYSLEVPGEDAVIVFSSVGFLSEELVVGNQSIIDLVMTLDITALDEIIVVGYGSQESREVTGAISQISGKEFESIPVTSVENALQGRAAGVQIVQNGGSPGGPSTVKIRGISTINNDEPLYVIDGVPVQSSSQNFRTGGSPLNSINPNDIASIEVLKDASSAAIYGSRASAGVILITTKKGKSGKLQVNYDGYYGITSNKNQRLDYLMSRDEYVTYANRFVAQRNADILATNPSASLPPTPTALFAPADSLSGTDFVDEVLVVGKTQSHNISLSGGNDYSTFFISLDYYNQGGTLKNTDFERYTLRINTDHKIGNRIKLGQTLNVGFFDRNRIGSSNAGILEGAAKMNPLLPPYNPNNIGGINQPGLLTFGHEYDNPLIFTDLHTNEERSYNILANAYAEIKIMEGLSFKSEAGVNFNYTDIRSFNPRYTLPQDNAVRPSRLDQSRSQNASPIFINSLIYNQIFGEHKISAVAAIEKVQSIYSVINGSGTDLPVTDDANVLGQVSAGTQNVGGSSTEWGLLSYLGRVNYSYGGRYFLTASIRRDGTSKVQKERYDVFPSFSLGWRLSDEPFFKGIEAVTNLKIRGGYGELGNVSSLGNYQTQTPVTTGITYVNGINEQLVSGATVLRSSNPNIAWEKVNQTNVGVDLGLFQNKLEATVDYFVKNTSQMIYTPPVPASTGNRPAQENIGAMKNSGFEFSLAHTNRIGDFTYDVSVNLTTINNKLVKLSTTDQAYLSSGGTSGAFGNMSTSRSVVGYPVGQFYGYVYDGIHQVGDDLTGYAGARPGDIRYKDINSVDENGDIIEGVPDGVFNSNDRMLIGNPLPDFTYGLNLNAGYKGFDLTLFFLGSKGNEIYNVQRQTSEVPNDFFNKSNAVLDAWTPQNTDTEIPRYNVSNSNYVTVNSRFIEDGSYFRLKNITIGYSLPPSIVEKAKLSKARFYISGQNLFTVTKYTGLDPEVGSESGSALELGIDNGLLSPVPTMFIGGVQIGF